MMPIEQARLKTMQTPVYVVDERLIEKNLKTLAYVQEEAGCKILLALKGFSMYALFPKIGEVLAGITASSLHEARLGYEEMGKEVHIYAPAYREDEIEAVMTYAKHMVFNSQKQYETFIDRALEKGISCGIRVNPEYSEIGTEIYNPCAPYSRLGALKSTLDFSKLKGIEGLHFHTLCEQNSDTLARTIKVVEEKFGDWMHQVKWVNFGGGHHITRADYDVALLIETIRHIKETYDVAVYLEPGEAIALNTGFLVTEVMDIVENHMPVAIIDASAACHMPDVIEMPYRPEIIGAGKPGEKAYTYRLGGTTCLAGDVVSDYSFDQPLTIGDKLIFTDMAHYTMVKNHMFNGVNLPDIAIMNETKIHVLKRFGYEDYKRRL